MVLLFFYRSALEMLEKSLCFSIRNNVTAHWGLQDVKKSKVSNKTYCGLPGVAPAGCCRHFYIARNSDEVPPAPHVQTAMLPSPGAVCRGQATDKNASEI